MSLSKKQSTKAKAQLKKLTWKESKELETIEQDIAKAESEVARLEELFSSSDFYEKHGSEIDILTKELADAKVRLDFLYSRWHELEEVKAGKSAP